MVRRSLRVGHLLVQDGRAMNPTLLKRGAWRIRWSLDVGADGSKLPTYRHGGVPVLCKRSWWSRRRWRATSKFSYRGWRGRGVLWTHSIRQSPALVLPHLSASLVLSRLAPSGRRCSRGSWSSCGLFFHRRCTRLVADWRTLAIAIAARVRGGSLT